MLHTMKTAKAPVRPIPPGPPGHVLLGNAGEIRQRGGHVFVLETMRRYGEISRYRVLKWPVYLLSHPDYIKHVLQDNHRNYGKNAFAFPVRRVYTP